MHIYVCQAINKYWNKKMCEDTKGVSGSIHHRTDNVLGQEDKQRQFPQSTQEKFRYQRGNQKS